MRDFWGGSGPWCVCGEAGGGACARHSAQVVRKP